MDEERMKNWQPSFWLKPAALPNRATFVSIDILRSH